MFKFRRLLCAALVCALVSVAYGAVVKLRSFQNVAEPDDGDGMAIMNYNQGQNLTSNQIILTGLLPDTAYVVVVEFPDLWCRVGNDVKFEPYFGSAFFVTDAGSDGSLVTNSNGHLTLHVDGFGGDYSNSDVLVFLYSDWLANFNPNFQTCTGIPVRMIACNPGASCAGRVCEACP